MQAEYLIKVFDDGEMTETHVVYERDLWEWLDRAKHQGIKIAVHKLGDCVIDWS